MSDVTSILNAIGHNDPRAASQLLPLVYDELRTLAARKMAREPAGQSLDATALVHEAYLRLIGGDPDKIWDGRAHFFAAAAEAMRRILVEKARAGIASNGEDSSSEPRLSPTKSRPPNMETGKSCSLSIRLWTSSRQQTRRRPSSSNYAISPAFRLPSRPRSWVFQRVRPTACGVTRAWLRRAVQGE